MNTSLATTFPRALIRRGTTLRLSKLATLTTRIPSSSFTPGSQLNNQFVKRNSSGARNMSSSSGPKELRFKNPVIFVCDLQEKFKNAIHEFDKVVTTTKKLLTFANAFSIPIITTTQTAAKLGPTVSSLTPLLPSTPHHDKTLFSMLIPSVAAELPSTPSQIALVGIESHICVTQSALDLRDAGHKVYVIADGVSSCNPQEVGIALDRLRSEPGITVTSSESWMYECVGDAAHPGFKGLIGVVKGSVEDTKNVWKALPPKL